MKYRKKPIIIDAWQFKDALMHAIPGVCLCSNGNYGPHVHTMHNNQVMVVEENDYIIQESDGDHHYACKPDVFEATYELVEEKP